MNESPQAAPENASENQEVASETIFQFRAWLTRHHLVYDFGRGTAGRPSSAVLEAFRNDRTLRWTAGFSRFRRPTSALLRAHLQHRDDSTLYATNQQGCDELLMKADVDNKDGTGQAGVAADYLRHRYLGQQCVVEPSTGGKGLHVYFVVKVRFRRREDVRPIIDDYSDRVKSDPQWAAMGVSFDKIIGYPTLWERDSAGVFSIRQRGCAMRLPWLIGGLSEFTALRALDLSFFNNNARRSSAGNDYSSPENYLEHFSPC